MATAKEKGKKYSLVFATAVAFCTVCTAGVSTFAWFQATANVSISATNSSTEITVRAPDPVGISNPDVYMYRGNPTGTSVTGTPYTPVSTAGLRTISNFYPGDSVTFAIKVTATSGSISTGSMDLTYRGYSLSSRTIQGTGTLENPLKVINILSAIRVSTGANGTGAYPSMTQKLSPLSRGSEPLLSSLTQVDSSTSYYKQATISNAINSANIGNATAYLFFTIDFLNTSATFYEETDSEGDDIHVTPADVDDKGDPIPITRYFTGSNDGSSSCYEHLDFKITKADVRVA